MRDAMILGFALEQPWAITPEMLTVLAQVIARHASGQAADPAELAALETRSNLPKPIRGGGVMVIPVQGVIAPKVNQLSAMSGGTSFQSLTQHIEEALANEAVSQIVLDIDSPGGNVAGMTEFAATLRRARAQKPVLAQIEYLGASAAFTIAASATEIIAAPSASVGSVGVYTMHSDISEALAQLGIKRSIISAGKFKAEGADGGPLTDEHRAHIKSIIDSHYAQMVSDIAIGRGVKASDVRSGYGEGRCVTAAAAKDLGMIDRIGTMAETLARLATPAPRAARLPAATLQEPSPATSQEQRSRGELQGLEVAFLNR